jgi:hypothetical protein
LCSSTSTKVSELTSLNACFLLFITVLCLHTCCKGLASRKFGPLGVERLTFWSWLYEHKKLYKCCLYINKKLRTVTFS